MVEVTMMVTKFVDDDKNGDDGDQDCDNHGDYRGYCDYGKHGGLLPCLPKLL